MFKGEEDYTDTSFFEKALEAAFALDKSLSDTPTLEEEYEKDLREIGAYFNER